MRTRIEVGEGRLPGWLVTTMVKLLRFNSNSCSMQLLLVVYLACLACSTFGGQNLLNDDERGLGSDDDRWFLCLGFRLV